MIVAVVGVVIVVICDVTVDVGVVIVVGVVSSAAPNIEMSSEYTGLTGRRGRCTLVRDRGGVAVVRSCGMGAAWRLYARTASCGDANHARLKTRKMWLGKEPRMNSGRLRLQVFHILEHKYMDYCPGVISKKSIWTKIDKKIDFFLILVKLAVGCTGGHSLIGRCLRARFHYTQNWYHDFFIIKKFKLHDFYYLRSKHVPKKKKRKF